VSTGHANAEGVRTFDAEVARMLGGETHPQITFVSSSIERTGERTGLITGDLTMNGVTRPVVLETTFHGSRTFPQRNITVMAFSARTVIQRSDFGVTAWQGLAGEDVEIVIEAEFGRTNT
jgi:polyisoprenoid-binding protein YceI